MKSGYYVHFDILFNKMNKKQQQIVNILVSMFTLILFGVLTLYALQFVKVGIPEHSPSLGVSMAIAFISIVIMGLFVSFYACLDLLKKWKR